MAYTVELTQLSSAPQAYQLSLLDDENQPIGYAMGEFRQYVVWYEGQPYFFLNDLVISDQAQQQQGFGDQLLQEVEAFARREGAYWIRGHVDPQSVSYTTAGTDKRTLGKFLGKHGYGLKREIHDDSIRFWKPLRRLSGS
ncbi:GNAT family N-acetyltransferase [Spirosoma validum]|uniref:GNAT family N-acetyltransferase n=1 Tax=Spirosoma validum TaxID=2771355 RepID=A0A927GGE3_9BACT|nr:GNAT family N-acetyltransferase [Spirosoma validum]MBD2756789.1 GNAT family N-acetyltransferase [Spirosoma validum]